MSTDAICRVDSSGPHPAPPRIGRWMFLVRGVVMLAGLLFGYDQGVISGALEGIQQSFSVSTFMLEVITNWVTLGAMVGALLARVTPVWWISLENLAFSGCSPHSVWSRMSSCNESCPRRRAGPWKKLKICGAIRAN